MQTDSCRFASQIMTFTNKFPSFSQMWVFCKDTIKLITDVTVRADPHLRICAPREIKLY